MRSIRSYFKNITGKDLTQRDANRPIDRIVRKDMLLGYLTALYYDNPAAFKELTQMVILTRRYLHSLRTRTTLWKITRARAITL